MTTVPGGCLQGKVFIVTGASRGIGNAIARGIVAQNGKVVGVARGGDRAQGGHTAPGSESYLLLRGDVADPDCAALAVDTAMAHFGRLDGLVNNAGISQPAMLTDITLDSWRRVLEINLTACFLLTQCVGRHLISEAKSGGVQGGSIVNVSSDAGRRGTVGQAHYAASKAGLHALTMSAAREWGKHNIRVNTVSFGVIETEMTEKIRSERFAKQYLENIPLGRWATADEVAPTVCHLLSSDSQYITGQHVAVNGGLHISY